MTNDAPSNRTLADILLGYAARGWPVLPLHGIRNGHCTCSRKAKCAAGAGKHPRTQRGLHDASTDPDTIREWISKYHDANWAIAGGRPLPDGGHLLILDVDPRNGGKDSLANLPELPDTVSAASGGNGMHYLFRTPTPQPCGRLTDGIDIKASGGYIVVAPSTHASGGSYSWRNHPDEHRIAEAPDFILQRATSAPRPSWSGMDATNSLLGEAFRLAGYLGQPLSEGRRAVRCPWSDQHSDGRGLGHDSSTVLLPPTADSNLGGFKCSHSHCCGKTWKDALNALPSTAVAQARERYRPKAADSLPPTTPDDPIAAWEARMHTVLPVKHTASGTTLERSTACVRAILVNDPRWAGRVRHNLLTDRVEMVRPPWPVDLAPPNMPEIYAYADVDATRLHCWLSSVYHIAIETGKIHEAIQSAAQANPYDPVVEYLSSLVWDGTPRVDRFFPVYFGAADTSYIRGVSRRWLVAAVARAYSPGCKVDNIVVLEGAQGVGKSTGLEALVPDRSWFSGSHIPIGADGPEAHRAVLGKWILEFAELDGINRAELTRVKAFLTDQCPSFRQPYGREYITVPRRCVFAGTTNDDSYLRDPTGGRRFWPVPCSVVHVERIREDRDQIWAEAVAYFNDGATWHEDDPSFVVSARAAQEQRYESDPWEDMLRTKLADVREISVADVLVTHLGKRESDVSRGDQMRVSHALKRMGFVRRHLRGRWVYIQPTNGGTT